MYTTVDDLVNQFLTLAPPFVGVLDANGASSFVLPPGTITPAAAGIVIYGVTATYDPLTLTPTGHSLVAAIVLQ